MWLSPAPLQETNAEALDALRDDDRELPSVLMSGKSARQLLQMADICAYAAFQSLQRKRNTVFASCYENSLGRLIQRPFGVEAGRCIRGFDYSASPADCPSERLARL